MRFLVKAERDRSILPLYTRAVVDARGIGEPQAAL